MDRESQEQSAHRNEELQSQMVELIKLLFEALKDKGQTAPLKLAKE